MSGAKAKFKETVKEGSRAKDVFITDDFLLGSEAARILYHTYAEGLPIVDFHSHLPPDRIADDARFENLTQLWLVDDHYAWRAMRANGIDEGYITGNASDWEKFLKWAETVPKALGNPLYHWVHMELKRPFGIRDRLFGPDTAEGIWEECCARLRSGKRLSPEAAANFKSAMLHELAVMN